MPQRHTYEEVLKEFESRGYVLLEKNYRNNKQLLRYKCNNHPEFEQRIRFNDLTMAHGCKYCGRERINEAVNERAKMQIKPIDLVEQEFKRRGYTFIRESYKGTRYQIQYKCGIHKDKVLKIKFSDLKRGGGCRYCAIEAMKLSYEEVQKRFAQKGYILLDKEYINNQTPMLYICPNHPDIETRISVDAITQGHGCTHCAIEASRGKLSAHYNHNVSDEERAKDRRYDAQIHGWRKEVYRRDNYTCVKCGDARGGNLNAHHKDGYAWCIDRRYDIENGATLCETCHRGFHSAYGNRDNTESQFNEWIKEASE